jgi:hypothetical protein
MPPRKKKSVRKAPVSDRKIAAKGKSAAGKLKQQRFAATGRTTRVQGHVSARGKRAQARRDAR